MLNWTLPRQLHLQHKVYNLLLPTLRTWTYKPWNNVWVQPWKKAWKKVWNLWQLHWNRHWLFLHRYLLLLSVPPILPSHQNLRLLFQLQHQRAHQWKPNHLYHLRILPSSNNLPKIVWDLLWQGRKGPQEDPDPEGGEDQGPMSYPKQDTMIQLQRKAITCQDTKDLNIWAPRSATRLIGILHLPIHRQPTLHQLQVERETTQYFEDPTLFNKFIKMTDLLYTKKNQKNVITEEVIHQDQPLQAIQKNLWSAWSRDQEPEAHPHTNPDRDPMLPHLDQSHSVRSLAGKQTMDGTNQKFLHQKRSLNPYSWISHRLKSK